MCDVIYERPQNNKCFCLGEDFQKVFWSINRSEEGEVDIQVAQLCPFADELILERKRWNASEKGFTQHLARRSFEFGPNFVLIAFFPDIAPLEWLKAYNFGPWPNEMSVVHP